MEKALQKNEDTLENLRYHFETLRRKRAKASNYDFHNIEIKTL